MIKILQDILQFTIEYKYVLLFYGIVILVLYLIRDKFTKQGIMLAYKSKFGIIWIGSISKRFREWIKLLGISGIGLAYIGLIGVTAIILKSAWDTIFKKSAAAGASLVVPGFPIAGTGLVLPLVTCLIALFVIILVHEGAHGVVAKAFNYDIKSTGIIILGPILGAFVEPDEKKLAKASSVEQYSIYAAGPMSNVVLSAIAFALMIFITTPLFAHFSEGDGIKIGITDGYPAKEAGLFEGSIITNINGIETHDIAALSNVTGSLKPNDTIIVTAYDIKDKSTLLKNYTFLAAVNPNDSSKGYMGITIQEAHRIPAAGQAIWFAIIKWLNGLMYWIFFLSINIGLINLFPMFITDGARMLYTTCKDVISDEKKAIAIWKKINMVALITLLILIVIPFIRWLLSYV